MTTAKRRAVQAFTPISIGAWTCPSRLWACCLGARLPGHSSRNSPRLTPEGGLLVACSQQEKTRSWRLEKLMSYSVKAERVPQFTWKKAEG